MRNRPNRREALQTLCSVPLYAAHQAGSADAGLSVDLPPGIRSIIGNITDEGDIRSAYTGWAMPAEQRVLSMDEHRMEWIPGFILIVANEMTLR